MLHLYRCLSDSRRVLIKEWTGEPPKNPRIEKSIFRDTLAWGGYATNDRGSTNPTGPWILRFDDTLERDRREHEWLLERLAMKDDNGGPLIKDIVPFSPSFNEMRPDEVEAEVQRMVDERLAKERETMEAMFMAKHASPVAQVVTEGSVGGTTQYARTTPGNKRPWSPSKPVRMWTCPACGEEKQYKARLGHARLKVQNGHPDHMELFRDLETEAKMSKLEAGVA